MNRRCEEHWPYNIANFDREPTPFCYAFAQSYQAIKYYRLDPSGTHKNTLLPKCGAKFEAASKFCPDCGAKMG